MTKTARRRWTHEFQGEIDGIAFDSRGPVFVHGYDPPAGGKWIDNVIPGKLGAFDRTSGEELWVSPCEVGYGRGFGSGLGEEDDVVLLGPSIRGHRIARMSQGTGELIGAQEIEAFDQAIVAGDVSVTVTSNRVAGIMTTPMVEVWAHQREGERYHIVGRDGERVFVVYTDMNRKTQGVACLDAESGDFLGNLLQDEFPVIHDLVVDEGLVILLVGNRPPGGFRRSDAVERIQLCAFGTRSSEAMPLWRQDVPNDSTDGLPDVSISLDSGKLYMADGALLDVRDGLTGRGLGQLTLPGLDERIAWEVSQGAGLLAEETRASVFELPA